MVFGWLFGRELLWFLIGKLYLRVFWCLGNVYLLCKKWGIFVWGFDRDLFGIVRFLWCYGGVKWF